MATLRVTWEAAIKLIEFKNIDLVHQGVYRVSVRLLAHPDLPPEVAERTLKSTRMLDAKFTELQTQNKTNKNPDGSATAVKERTFFPLVPRACRD